MEAGFVRGDSNNLPKVDICMIMHFFASNPLYTSAEIRGAKLLKSGRDTYGDDAIGYVQVKRDVDLCFVKARITPEHRVRNTPYHCTFECNEKDEIITKIECEDCAAREGGCKHGIALLMWLHRRSEEPSCTSKKCYWAKAKLSKVGSNLKFIKASDMVMSSAKNQKKTSATVPDQQSPVFLEQVIEKSRSLHISSQLMQYNKLSVNSSSNFSLHYLICKFKNQDQINVHPDEFISFCQDHMQNNNQLEMVSQATRDQSDCSLWYELRYGRITASKIYEIAHCDTSDGTLVETIMGAYTFKETMAIKRGKLLERTVRDVVAKRKNITIKDSGLILNKNFPIIGSSPGGLSDEFVLEIKCPLKKKSFKNYICDDGIPAKKFMAQMQLQMYFSGKNRALFCLAHEDFETTKEVDIYNVDFDETYCLELIERAMAFWKENIFKKLLLE